MSLATGRVKVLNTKGKVGKNQDGVGVITSLRVQVKALGKYCTQPSSNTVGMYSNCLVSPLRRMIVTQGSTFQPHQNFTIVHKYKVMW